MAGKPFGFCGPTFQTRDGLWQAERCVNFYPARNKEGKTQVALLGTPGLSLFATVGSPVRGLWAGDDRLFAVGSNTLYEIASDGTPTTEGTLNSSPLPVEICGNGNSLLIVSGQEAFLANGAGSVSKVNDLDSACYLDGYFVGLEKDTNNIVLSGINNGATWNAADTQARFGVLDRMLRVFSHKGQLWLFGKKTTEVWYNAGNADYPFERVQGSTMSVGLSAKYSVAQVDDSLYWVSSDEHGVGVVYRSQGYSPKRVSNPAIEYLIKTYRDSTSEEITGYGYQEDGHSFYVLNFPISNVTLVYDITEDLWHERLTWSSSAWHQWHGGSFHCFTFNRHLVACIGYGGKIYTQSLGTYGDEGGVIRRYRIAPYVAADQQWLFHHYLRLHTLSTTSTTMRWRADDGATWSAAHTATPSNHEVRYNRLGRGRDRLYEVAIESNNAAQAIIEAYLDASPGTGR